MSEDIIFCLNCNCKNQKCLRHQCNIKNNFIPHSFAFFEDCEYWDWAEYCKSLEVEE